MTVLQPGALLDGRYRVLRSLAEGGFGHTYIAEDTRRPGNPECVVKHLKPTNKSTYGLSNARDKFAKEAKVLDRLGEHNQIPRLLAFFEENEEFYLVQEYVAGHTLTRELSPGQSLEESQLGFLLQEVLSVLAFVHENRVIHRDIKPDNIIRRAQDNKLILVDFGAVKEVRMNRDSGELVSATISIGTPGYMPNEQALGEPKYSSDLYSLGLIGVQLATGFALEQVRKDQQTGELVWKPWSRVSEKLTSILEKMVYYHFKERYQSVSEVLTDLDPHLQSLSSDTVDNSPSQEPQQTVVSGQSPKPQEPQQTVVSGQPPEPQEPQQTVVSGQPPLSQEPQQTVVSDQPSPSQEPQQTVVSGQPSLPNLAEQRFNDKRSQSSWKNVLYHSLLAGSGAWLLAVALISLVGTIWLSTAFWLIFLCLIIFAVYARASQIPEKLLLLAAAILSTGLAFYALPGNIQYDGIFDNIVYGISVVVLLTVFSGAIAFMLLMTSKFINE